MRFGPAGNSRRFYDEGFKRTEQAFCWLHDLGLTAYEYSMGRGVHLSEETARAAGREAQKYGILTSVHAPYFINCCSPDAGRREKSVGYLMQAARAAAWLGAERVVFHVGAPAHQEREAAMNLARATIDQAHASLDAAGLGAITLCPETMGRMSQTGTLDEVLSLCARDSRLIPALDFGHLHAIGQGALNSEADFGAVLQKMVDALGLARAKHFHVHFSHIDFGPKGEKRHMNFSDAGYGPDFRRLAPVLVEMGLEPVVICESAGDQADDAVEMQRMVREFKQDPAAFRDCERMPDMV